MLLLAFRVGVQAPDFLFGLFLVARLLLMAALLLARITPRGSISLRDTLVAWSSALLPFLYETETFTYAGGEWLATTFRASFALGLVFSTWGYFSLGKAFGVAPAYRMRVSSGAYRYFSHPIYAGYSISESSWLILEPTAWNLLVYLISMSLYLWRARREEVVLSVETGYIRPHA
jgi:protein-S-isoprenylcysteine O-methyltransferase Ste14